MSADDCHDDDESLDESGSDSDEPSDSSMEDEIDFTQHMNQEAKEELEDNADNPVGMPNICTKCGYDLTDYARINVYEARDELIPAYRAKFFVFCDYRCLIRYAAKFKPSVSTSS